MRTLIYTCCDKKYSHFIPLFIYSALYSNSDIDIEIGTSAESLEENENEVIDIIKSLYPNNKILIRFNLFKELEQGHSEYNNLRVLTNTIRFIVPPILKADYVYITDIDIIMLEKEFYNLHIKNMNNLNMNYSNIVRKNTKRLSGLHFSNYDTYYPIDLNNIDLSKNDEEILFDIVKNKQCINLLADYRPVHGIHMSLNRPSVEGNNEIPGWGAKNWKNEWLNITNTDIFSKILNCMPDYLYNNIIKLNEYYSKI